MVAFSHIFELGFYIYFIMGWAIYNYYMLKVFLLKIKTSFTVYVLVNMYRFSEVVEVVMDWLVGFYRFKMDFYKIKRDFQILKMAFFHKLKLVFSHTVNS